MIYYLSIGLIGIFSIITQSQIQGILGSKKLYTYLTIASFLLFIVLGGLRFEVGADWEPYGTLFEETTNWSATITSRVETLFSLFMLLCKFFSNSYLVFIFLLFTISFILKFITIKRYSPDIHLSLCIYLFTVFLIYDINGLRQGLAIGILFQTIPFIINRKFLNFMLLVLMATFCHISAIIFFPFYFIANFKISNRNLFFSLAPIIGLSFLAGRSLESSVLFQNLLTADRLLHYSVYLTPQYQNADESFFSVALLQRLFIFIIFLHYYDRIKAEERLKLLLRNGYFASVIIFIIFSFSSEFSARLGFYYKSLEIIIIPMLVSSPSSRVERLVLASLFIAFCFAGTFRLLSLPDGHLLPYHNILTNLLF